jgi:GAF domain-containing protein
MTAFLTSLTERYARRAEKDQAYLIYGFTLIMLVLFAAYALFVDQGRSTITLVRDAGQNIASLIAILAMLGIGGATLLLTRIGRADIAAYGPIVMWYLSGVLIAFGDNFLTGDEGASLVALIVMCALFLRSRGVVVGTVVALITLAVSAASYDRDILTLDHYIGNTVGLGLVLVGVSALIYMFLRGVRLDRLEGTARAVEDRYKLASVTTQIAQRISRRTALDDLRRSTVDDIRDSYADIYHAQIFLLDEATQEAQLSASTGEVGKRLLERRHSLPVGSQSVIGTVTALGEAVVARAGLPDSVHRRNELLPDTAVEAAFPLKIGETVIGALDLQSRFASAFAPDEVPVFQSLADNIAVAIDNARLFAQTEQRLQENQHLLEQMRGAVAEVERLNRELTQQVWTQYLGSKGGQLSVDLDFSNNAVRHAGDWTPTLHEAAQSNDLVQTPIRDGIMLSVPLRVRGLVVGAMEFELPGESLAPEEIDLVEAVAERFGLAVESTRLYEESRRVAQRETMLNEIGSRMQRTNSIDALLGETARGLQTSLGANRVAIRLGTPPAEASKAGAS